MFMKADTDGLGSFEAAFIYNLQYTELQKVSGTRREIFIVAVC